MIKKWFTYADILKCYQLLEEFIIKMHGLGVENDILSTS